MYSTFSKPLVMLLILFGGFFIACQKEDEVITADTFVTESIEEIETRSGTGVRGCYELVFPVTIQFRDSTTAEVASYEEMRQAIRDWYESNGVRPGRHDRPVIVMPFQVINEAGEIITVETQEQLAELVRLCRQQGGPGSGPGNHGNHGNHGPCYELVFPITVSFPDSSQVTVNSNEEMRAAVRAYKEAHPDQHRVHPAFVYPITVTIVSDSSQVVVNSAEELRAIKQACRG
jgi:hypothetical protein